METILTTLPSMAEKAMQDLCGGTSKKERKLLIFCEQGTQLDIPVVQELLGAPNAMVIQLLEYADVSEAAFEIGSLTGKDPNGIHFWFAPEKDGFLVSDALMERYGFKRFTGTAAADPKPADTAPKKRRTRKTKAASEENQASEEAQISSEPDTKSDAVTETQEPASEAAADSSWLNIPDEDDMLSYLDFPEKKHESDGPVFRGETDRNLFLKYIPNAPVTGMQDEEFAEECGKILRNHYNKKDSALDDLISRFGVALATKYDETWEKHTELLIGLMN